jgi:hypothetical protein
MASSDSSKATSASPSSLSACMSCVWVCGCARARVKEIAVRDNGGKAGERLGTRRRSERD